MGIKVRFVVEREKFNLRLGFFKTGIFSEAYIMQRNVGLVMIFTSSSSGCMVHVTSF